jgi:hypothetical protein
MRTILAFIAVALLIGCAHTPTRDFVQGSIRITPPIKMDQIAHPIIEDGGTAPGRFTDATGREFDFYIDHRIGTKTPGAIYLLAYPGERKSVRVKNEVEFKQKLAFE